MNWSECKNFGVIDIDSVSNTIRLYYNQWSFCLAGNPIFIRVEDAIWQGNNLVIKGYNTSSGQRLVYIMDGFSSYRQMIF